jgi:hypothetical protein
MRRAARRDDNENAVVEALLAVGATVHRLDETGVPDLLVGFRRQTFLIEVKGPRGKLTGDQVAWHRGWRGAAAHVVRTPTEALRAIGAVQ